MTARFGDNTELMMIEPKRKLLSGIGGLSGSLAGGIVDDAAQIAIERAYLSRFGL